MSRVFLFSCLIATSFAIPASNEALDKATINDVDANNVAPSDIRVGNVQKINGADLPTAVPSVDPTDVKYPDTFKPQQGASTFARLIDDIFQIPISVLQSVAKLITNPFKSFAGGHTESPVAS